MCVGHRANVEDSDCESDTSGEPEGLTDSSSEDDTVAPGGHVRRIVKGIEKLRRVRRVRGHRSFAPFRQDSEDEPPGLNPSSDEECHDSDNDSVDDLFPEDHQVSRAHLPGGDSTLESGYGNATPNTPDQRTILRPSTIEETAIAVCSYALSECEELDHHPPVGSVGWSLFNTDDGSCKGTIHRPRKRQPLQAETLDQCSRALTGISMLQELPRSGISAVQRPDEWVLIDVTVDSGACVSVMPAGLCTGISIVDNDLSRGGVEYEVANGESIASLGERRCQVMTVGSMIPKQITFQVADVHKPLLSITACSDLGFDCYLGKEGGSLRNRMTGEVIPLERRGSLYSLRMWVRQDPGVNSNSSFVGPV